MKKRQNLPQVELRQIKNLVEKEQVAVTQKEETVRKGFMG